MKRIVLLCLTMAVFAAPAGAHGAVPCRDRIYNEWYASGKVSTNYPVSCYRDAIKHIPADAQVYSNLGSDIKAAMQAAIARKNDPSGGGPSAVGSGPAPTQSTTSQTKAAIKTKKNPALLAAPVAADTSSGGGIPTPILVLGGLALALAAAGAVGTGVKVARTRRRA